jgi:hypothetical protein
MNGACSKYVRNGLPIFPRLPLQVSEDFLAEVPGLPRATPYFYFFIPEPLFARIQRKPISAKQIAFPCLVAKKGETLQFPLHSYEKH